MSAPLKQHLTTTSPVARGFKPLATDRQKGAYETMKKNRRKNNTTKELLVTYAWLNRDGTYDSIEQTYTNSAGLAMLEADWCIEVLKVERVRG